MTYDLHLCNVLAMALDKARRGEDCRELLEHALNHIEHAKTTKRVKP